MNKTKKNVAQWTRAECSRWEIHKIFSSQTIYAYIHVFFLNVCCIGDECDNTENMLQQFRLKKFEQIKHVNVFGTQRNENNSKIRKID